MNKWYMDYQQGIEYIVDHDKLRINVCQLDTSTINQIINAHNKEYELNGQQSSDLSDSGSHAP